jgi:hypothetical protein
MAESTTLPDGESERDSGESDFHRYVRVLAPLFDPTPHMRNDRLFEYVCCLVRAGGIEAQDSDPIAETTALVEDLRNLSALDLRQFPQPQRTSARLALLAYCHVVEADFFYRVLASLAKLRAGHRYDMNPFRGLARKRKDRILPPSLAAKIKRVNELCAAVGVETAPLFDEVYFPDIRNAVFHADYALSDDTFRMLGGWFKSKKGYLTPAVSLDELGVVIQRAFAFYSAVMQLHERARHQLMDFKDMIVPYDGHYKGLLELLFEDDALAGYRAYWPNASNSEFSRTRAGCSAMNVTFDDDGSMNFMVGLYAPKGRRSAFSPLVEEGTQPTYRAAAPRTVAPHWPEDLKPYRAE